MSINDFHASLTSEDNTELASLRSLRSAQGQIEDDPMDGWIPWS